MPPITDPIVIAVVRQVQQELTPENYNQGEWCGAACCIAGHVELVAKRLCPERLLGDTHCDRAAMVLGVRACALNERLFDGDPGTAWPDPFASEWDKTRWMRPRESQTHRVDIARRRLDYFLEHGE